MIDQINKAWNWIGFNATEIIRTNEFGNVIFKTDKNDYWRICPEEISCKKIAETKSELDQISSDPEFIKDWEMIDLVNIAKSKLGVLKENERFCLKMSPVIGGEYEKSNLGKITFPQLIAFSGDLAFQLKDLKDGQKINLDVNS